jgi:hypothetical protein
MKKQPYRITIEQYEYKYSVEVDHSDIDFTEYVDILRQISLASGWSINMVEDFFEE